MELHGKTVLITGGASGIGLAMARAFSKLGNRVLICGRNPEHLAQAERINPEFRVFRCDVTQPDQVGTMFQAIADQHADLSILVNNAGIAFPSELFRRRRGPAEVAADGGDKPAGNVPGHQGGATAAAAQ